MCYQGAILCTGDSDENHEKDVFLHMEVNGEGTPQEHQKQDHEPPRDLKYSFRVLSGSNDDIELSDGRVIHADHYICVTDFDDRDALGRMLSIWACGGCAFKVFNRTGHLVSQNPPLEE